MIRSFFISQDWPRYKKFCMNCDWSMASNCLEPKGISDDQCVIFPCYIDVYIYIYITRWCIYHSMSYIYIYIHMHVYIHIYIYIHCITVSKIHIYIYVPMNDTVDQNIARLHDITISCKHTHGSDTIPRNCIVHTAMVEVPSWRRPHYAAADAWILIQWTTHGFGKRMQKALGKSMKTTGAICWQLGAISEQRVSRAKWSLM